MILETLTIAARFCGPPASGNGGYVCGRVARHIAGTASVRLFVPPPIDTPLTIEESQGVYRLMAGEQLVAEGRAAQLDESSLPTPPDHAEAVQASKSYLGFSHHSFPRCFVCGPQRSPGDGLRIFAGPIEGRSLVAAPWTADDSLAEHGVVAPHFLWAALDCPSAFAMLPVAKGKAIVLGQLTARIESQVQPGEACVVVGWPIQADGRKRIAGSAIYSGSGVLVGLARAVWIEVAESAFAGS